MKTNILFLLVIFLSVSCETIVEVSINDGNKTLVSESYLEFSNQTKNGSARVYLTESTSFYDESNPVPVSGATVSINDTYLLVEDEDSLGLYISSSPIPYQGESSFVLDIQAEIDGIEGHWFASDDFSQIPEIESLYYVFDDQVSFFQDSGYYVNVSFTDPVDAVNFYHLSVEINDTLSFELTPGTKRSSIFKDEYINGMALDFPVNDVPLKIGEELKLILSSISENTYYYYFNLYTLLTETFGIGAPPPFPLQGNVISINDNFSNGLGNFQVRSSAIRTIRIED